jgi:hypothetical protein
MYRTDDLSAINRAGKLATFRIFTHEEFHHRMLMVRF